MDNERWQHLSRLFAEARHLTDHERADYLVRACAGDEALRSEIEAMLAGDVSDAFLQPVATPALPTPGHVWGGYRIERELGHGGMGRVFLAYDTRLQRPVAIKALRHAWTDSASSRRLLHEARSAAALNHPAICTIYEVGDVGGVPFIAMEYVEGTSLRRRLDHGALPLADSRAFGVQVADALAYAHDHNVVHRDLKAANIMVTTTGQLKIVDFGLALRDDLTSSGITVVPTGVVAGTPATMAPEQVRGDTADARTDVWALGVLLYEMVSGTLPFRAPTASELFDAILRDPAPALPPRVPVALRALIAQCLEKNPARRFQRAAELRDALQAMDAIGEPPARWWRTSTRASAILAMVVAVAALAIGVNVDFDGVWLRSTNAPAGQAFDSLAVLPLEDLSGPGQDYFAAGMHDALIVGLGKLTGLRRIIARPSVLRFARTDRSLRDVARELGVQALITGTVLQSGSRVRVTAQLIDPTTERQLWGDSYERDVRDVLSLQDDIVAAIARQVQLRITPSEQARLSRARQVNPEAYRTYLRGVFQVNTLTPGGFEKGMALLRDAVTLDPTEPLAYAGLARGYGLAEVFGPATSPDDARRAVAAARRALELDPELAEAHAAVGIAKFAKEWDYGGAEESFRNALRINPNLAETHVAYAQYLSIFGQEAEAVAEWQRGVQLDPLSPLYAAWFAGAWWEFGRFEHALTEAQRALDIQPDFPPALFVQGLALLETGRPDDALAVHRRLLAIYPQQAFTWVLARSNALAGQVAEARRTMAGVKATPPTDLLHPWFIAAAYTAIGDREEALDWLERAYDMRLGFLVNIGRERAVGFDLRPLGSHPRFQALVKKMNPTRTGRSAG